MTKIVTVVGNRPQFVKLGVTARRLRELGDAAPFESVVVNTGQHYDTMLSDVFFSELEIEPPHYNLGMGSGHLIDQIGRMLTPLREIVESERPDGVLVYGDTNSTVAAGIVAGHLGVPLFHVEGGERLYRRIAMPEEVNRIVTDHLAELCLASSRKAVRYLEREGFGSDRVRFVGDPMYDIFLLTGAALVHREAKRPEDYGLAAGEFVLSTMHRAENTDSRETGIALMEALDSSPLPVLLPAHPRLRHRLEGWGWTPRQALRLIEPLGYFDFQSLLRQCALAVSDSGGVNREAFFAGKGCIVPLDSSAWIEAVEAGFAVTVGSDAERLSEALASFRPSGEVEAIVRREFGDGDAGARIVDAVAAHVAARGARREGPWHALGHYDDLPKPHAYAGLSRAGFAAQIEAIRQVGYSIDLPTAAADRSCTLLHIVDQDVESAAALARIEAEAGLAGVYFVAAAGAEFNPFSADATAAIREILSLGHALGLLSERGGDPEREAALLESWFGAPVRARMERGDDGMFSLPDLAGYRVHVDLDHAGSAAPLAAAADGTPLALVIHPSLWTDIPTAPLEQGLRQLDDRRRQGLSRLRAGLPRYRAIAREAHG